MTKFLVALFLACSASIGFAADKAPTLDKNSCGKFEYPKAALINEETGIVSLSLLVATDGTVTDSKLDKSSGSKTLDKAAVKIYSACKYSPATKDGKSEQAWTKIEHVWSLT
ncbi:MAG: energy transducer TonB [Cytophaga sp.]|nr:energy transducer TonB [Undibacterium sp.]